MIEIILERTGFLQREHFSALISLPERKRRGWRRCCRRTCGYPFGEIEEAIVPGSLDGVDVDAMKASVFAEDLWSFSFPTDGGKDLFCSACDRYDENLTSCDRHNHQGNAD